MFWFRSILVVVFENAKLISLMKKLKIHKNILLIDYILTACNPRANYVLSNYILFFMINGNFIEGAECARTDA